MLTFIQRFAISFVGDQCLGMFYMPPFLYWFSRPLEVFLNNFRILLRNLNAVILCTAMVYNMYNAWTSEAIYIAYCIVQTCAGTLSPSPKPQPLRGGPPPPRVAVWMETGLRQLNFLTTVALAGPAAFTGPSKQSQTGGSGGGRKTIYDFVNNENKVSCRKLRVLGIGITKNIEECRL